MRALLHVLRLSCLLLVACDGNAATVDASSGTPSDAGGALSDASSRGGIGGNGPDDAGGNGPGGAGSGGSGGGGAGGVSGGVGTSGAQDGGGTAGSQSVFTCAERPQFVPDAGNDACLACAVERCCDYYAAFLCFADGSCYEGGLFGRIRQCIDDAHASGSSEQSWYLAVDCVRAEAEPFLLARDAGADPVPFQLPWSDHPAIALTHCLAGTLPVEDEDDGGVGPIRAAFEAAGYWPGDLTDLFPEPSCATECFPGWQ